MKYSRFALPLIAFVFTGCFQITHFLDLKDNGLLEVQWSFRFSKSLDEMKKDESGGISSEVEKGTEDLSESFGGQVRDLKMDKFQNDFDSGIRLSFSVPNYAKFDYSKMKEEEFPILPRFDARKKELLFHFTPLKKDKKEEEHKPEKKEDKQGGPAGSEPEAEDKPAEPSEGADEMGKKLGQLFLSSVRYQIILGKNLKPASVLVRRGTEERKVEPQMLADYTLIDLPLFALLGEQEQPFDLTVRLK